ncbi:MAG TPA: bifunctional DNA primase/polymerase [Streptosporangiaceae bacterium]
MISRGGMVLDLTGTAILNRPRELRQQLAILGRVGEFGGPKAFLWRYCLSETNQWGASYNGARNLVELHQRLLSWGIMIRRADDSALGLPPCREHVLHIPEAELDPAVMARYRQAEQDLLGYLAGQARTTAEQLGKDPAHAAVQAAMRAQAAEHLVAINTLRQLAGQAKRGYVTAWTREVVEAGEKVMVAAHHCGEVDAYAAAFGGLKLQGGQPVQEKEAAKAAFQQRPAAETPVIAVAIGAGGVGHTLTAASVGIQAEQAWTPGETQQMKKRLHRIGQDRPVDYYITVAEHTIDEQLWEVVTAKQATLNAVLDGKSDQGVADDENSIVADLAWRLTQQGLGSSPPADRAADGDNMNGAAQLRGPRPHRDESAAPADEGPAQAPGTDIATAPAPGRPARTLARKKATGNSWGHIVRALTADEIAFNTRHGWPCTTRKCREPVTFAVRYSYVTGRSGRVSDSERRVCTTHAAKFAATHGLPPPHNPDATAADGAGATSSGQSPGTSAATEPHTHQAGTGHDNDPAAAVSKRWTSTCARCHAEPPGPGGILCPPCRAAVEARNSAPIPPPSAAGQCPQCRYTLSAYAPGCSARAARRSHMPGTAEDDGDDDPSVRYGQALRQAAHLYLGHGLQPVPGWAAKANGECCCPRGADCPRPGKHPRSVHTGPGPRDYSWKSLACSTHDEVDQRFTQEGEYAAANLMLAIPAGMLVIDQDDDDGGRQAIAALAEQLGELPPTLSHSTPHGTHRIYRTPPGWTGRAWVGKDARNPLPAGIDLRVPGQILMAPPSQVPAANGLATYGPVAETGVAELPATYVTAWTPPQAQARAPRRRVPVPPDRADVAASYVHAKIEGIVTDLASREPGGRNTAIYTAALKVGSTLGAARTTPGAEHAAAAWTDEAAEDALMAAAERNGYIGKHGAAMARSAVRSGLRNGLRSPRPLPDFSTRPVPPGPGAGTHAHPTGTGQGRAGPGTACIRGSHPCCKLWVRPGPLSAATRGIQPRCADSTQRFRGALGGWVQGEQS